MKRAIPPLSLPVGWVAQLRLSALTRQLATSTQPWHRTLIRNREDLNWKRWRLAHTHVARANLKQL